MSPSSFILSFLLRTLNGLFIVLTLNSLRSAPIHIHSHNVSITKREDARRRRHNRSAPHHGRVSRLDQPAERCFESARNCRETRCTERYIGLFFHSSILWDGDPPAIPPSSQLSFPISFHPTYISLFSLPSPQLHATNHSPFSHSDNSSPTHRLSPAPNSTHFQAWHKLDVCNDSAVPPETTRRQGARECVLLRGECV